MDPRISEGNICNIQMGMFFICQCHNEVVKEILRVVTVKYYILNSFCVLELLTESSVADAGQPSHC